MNMQERLDVRPVAGEVGIEIELEGNNLPREDFGSWRAEHDGSLRGESIELVLKVPAPRDKVPTRLKSMAHKLEVLDSVVVDSGRAGIHAHINIQDLSEVELVNFICLYMTYENMLVEWCGKGRVGNLFCLRTCDASGYLNTLRKAVQTGTWRLLHTDEVRYASMNLKALCQYGSLEFRAMRSTVDPVAIQTWVDLLLALKDAAKRYLNPVQIVEQFSVDGPATAFMSTFRELSRHLRYDPASMLEGLRSAQMIAYCRPDWEEDPVFAKPQEVALDLIDEGDLWEIMERAHMRDDIHFTYKNMGYYRVKNNEFEGDWENIGRRWFTAEEIHFGEYDFEDGEDEEWMAYAVEYCDRYKDHARRAMAVRKRDAGVNALNKILGGDA